MNDSPPNNPTFEQSLAHLEAIVRELEDGQTGLEASLLRYEQGIGLLKRCYGQLQSAEQRINLLTGVDDKGEPVLQPFAHAPVAEALQADTARRRKKAPEGGGLY